MNIPTGVDWAAGTPGRFPVGRQDILDISYIIRNYICDLSFLLLLYIVICKVTHDFGVWRPRPSGLDAKKNQKMHKENKSREDRAAFCFFPGRLNSPVHPCIPTISSRHLDASQLFLW